LHLASGIPLVQIDGIEDAATLAGDEPLKIPAAASDPETATPSAATTIANGLNRLGENGKRDGVKCFMGHPFLTDPSSGHSWSHRFEVCLDSTYYEYVVESVTTPR